ncbi:ADIPL protein, partial [Rhodinocichla rosea]|nr:ADIPL protein [Rhodinocichla rosea]
PQLLEAADARLTDPRRTWISFVHRPDDGSNSKRRCKGKDKKLRGLVGPPGPPGPQGPPGAPGAEVTREVLLQEFKEILKGTEPEQNRDLGSAHRFRSSSGIQEQLRDLGSAQGWIWAQPRAGFGLSPGLDSGSAQGFGLSPGLSSVLSPQPVAKGAFLRGSGLNVATGRFTAPVGGIYQFSANIHIDHSELKSKVQLRARDSVRVLICIESLCHRHTDFSLFSLQKIPIFPISLQAGQYTSIFVDNGAGAAVTVQHGSDFMGMLLGA